MIKSRLVLSSQSQMRNLRVILIVLVRASHQAVVKQSGYSIIRKTLRSMIKII